MSKVKFLLALTVGYFTILYLLFIISDKWNAPGDNYVPEVSTVPGSSFPLTSSATDSQKITALEAQLLRQQEEIDRLRALSNTSLTHLDDILQHCSLRSSASSIGSWRNHSQKCLGVNLSPDVDYVALHGMDCRTNIGKTSFGLARRRCSEEPLCTGYNSLGWLKKNKTVSMQGKQSTSCTKVAAPNVVYFEKTNDQKVPLNYFDDCRWISKEMVFDIVYTWVNWTNSAFIHQMKNVSLTQQGYKETNQRI
jgi:hypothetical protein